MLPHQGAAAGAGWKLEKLGGDNMIIGHPSPPPMNRRLPLS